MSGMSCFVYAAKLTHHSIRLWEFPHHLVFWEPSSRQLLISPGSLACAWL